MVVERTTGESIDDRLAQWRFRPHRAVAGGHAQTVAGAFWRRGLHHALDGSEARLIEVEPGVRVLARCSWLDARRERPTLVIVHGLEGSDDSNYMVGTASKALAAGWNAVRLNLRNCGGTEHLSPTLYHSGMSGDVAAVVEHLIAGEGLEWLAVAGFSLGGNMVLKMAGEYGDAHPRALRAVVAVSPSIDLSASAAALERPSNLLYHRRFVRSLRRRMLRKAELFPGRYSVAGLEQLRTIREYDTRYIAPNFGFRDAEDYYERASALPHIAAIRVPALLLHAADDPFIPVTERVRQAVDQNPFVRLFVTERGGHVGFIAHDAPGEDRRWAENRIVAFVETIGEGRREEGGGRRFGAETS
jgi:predicted alpha/beta-fold hydrolase